MPGNGQQPLLPCISCICPTYKRPEQLRNALACFLAQDYPQTRCELIILDDAGQFQSQRSANWRLISTSQRYRSLSSKHNALLAECRGDIVAVWDDDDVFLPWNLRDVAQAYQQGGGDIFLSKNIWSNHNNEKGELSLVCAEGRFHSSWRFSRQLVESAGGYPESGRLSFDMELARRLKDRGTVSNYGQDDNPSYVYRWQSAAWNVSQHGDGEAYTALWHKLGMLPAAPQGELVARFDEETFAIYCRLSK